MLKELGFYRGVNLGGWMSQCKYTPRHMNRYITEADFAQIAAWGFDHVRIPVDYNVIQTQGGRMKFFGLRRVDKALALCRQYDLNAVLDLHKARGFSFNELDGEDGFFESEANQEKFYAIWECFAARYGALHDKVAFELLNEVTKKEYLEPWKRISKECVRRIRLRAPETLILLGSCDYNSAAALPELDAPYDGRVVYNFHFYEPHAFTHQGARWEAHRRDVNRRLSYAETGACEAYFEECLAPALAKAEQEGCELYCGEFGVIDEAAPEDRLAWFRDLHAVFERHGIARAVWSYKKMSFGLKDRRMDSVREELLKLMQDQSSE